MSNQKILKCHCADDCQQLFIDECGRPLRKVTCKFEDCENVLIYAHALKLSKYKCFSHREKFFAEAQRIADEADFAEAERIAAEASEFAEAERIAAEASEFAEAQRIAEASEFAEAQRIAAEASEFAEAQRIAAEASEFAEAQRKAAEASEFAEAQRIADEADFSEAQRIAEASDFAEAQRKAADATSTVNQEVVNSTMEIPKLNEYEDWAKIVSEAASFVYQTSSLNTFFSSTRNLLAEALSHDDFKVLAELLACPLSEFLRYSIFILLNISSISNELHIYSVLNI